MQMLIPRFRLYLFKSKKKITSLPGPPEYSWNFYAAQIPLTLKNPASEHALHTSKFPITPPYSFKIFLDPRLFKLNPSFSPMFAGNVLFAYLFYKFV